MPTTSATPTILALTPTPSDRPTDGIRGEVDPSGPHGPVLWTHLDALVIIFCDIDKKLKWTLQIRTEWVSKDLSVA